jgi:hypothetical protein
MRFDPGPFRNRIGNRSDSDLNRKSHVRFQLILILQEVAGRDYPEKFTGNGIIPMKEGRLLEVFTNIEEIDVDSFFL